MKLAGRLLDLLYPPKCPFCGGLLEPGEEGCCLPCRAALPRAEGVKTVDGCDACLSPLRYGGGVRDGIHRLKFGGGHIHAKLFGELMAQRLWENGNQTADVVVWTPLSRRSLRRRGYDQSELLARRVGELTGLPVEAALEKIRDTGVQSQAGEDAARRINVHGAYRVRPGADVAGRRIILVDDVVTSGATLSECAAALRRAGAESVTALTLARARNSGSS